MKVLMVHTWHYPRGGDSTYVHDLSSALIEAGHQVIPLAMRHPGNAPDVWSTRFPARIDASGSVREQLRAARSFVWNRDAERAARELIAATRPDVVHLNHIHRHLTPSVIRPAREAGLPVVWTVHDYELICPAGHLFDGTTTCTACRGHRYAEAVRRRCKQGRLLPSLAVALEKSVHAAMSLWSKVDRFLCPSAFLRDRLADFGVPEDRLHVLHNPVAVEPPNDDPGEGWLFAGRLTEEKGIRTLARAARHLDAPLTVFGDGPLASLLPDTVDHRGHQPPPRVRRALSRAGVVVVPSIWWENFPYAVTEAQAHGRCVVASDTGGIPEQIEHGVSGILVPPGDAAALAEAVDRLLDNPSRRRALGQAARLHVRTTLSTSKHLHRVLSHYEEVH